MWVVCTPVRFQHVSVMLGIPPLLRTVADARVVILIRIEIEIGSKLKFTIEL